MGWEAALQSGEGWGQVGPPSAQTSSEGLGANTASSHRHPAASAELQEVELLGPPPRPPPLPAESVPCRALPGLIKQGNEQLGWGDESPGWLEAGTVYDGLLQLVTLSEVSSYNPGGLSCSHSKPRECWVLEGAWRLLVRLRSGEQLVQASGSGPGFPQAQASLATTTCHPISFDAMAEPGRLP